MYNSKTTDSLERLVRQEAEELISKRPLYNKLILDGVLTVEKVLRITYFHVTYNLLREQFPQELCEKYADRIAATYFRETPETIKKTREAIQQMIRCHTPAIQTDTELDDLNEPQPSYLQAALRSMNN